MSRRCGKNSGARYFNGEKEIHTHPNRVSTIKKIGVLLISTTSIGLKYCLCDIMTVTTC